MGNIQDKIEEAVKEVFFGILVSYDPLEFLAVMATPLAMGAMPFRRL